MQNQQPGLHPQFVEVVLAGNTIDFRRDKAPIVEAAVERVKQLEHLGTGLQERSGACGCGMLDWGYKFFGDTDHAACDAGGGIFNKFCGRCD
jgi:hypothetical protein